MQFYFVVCYWAGYFSCTRTSVGGPFGISIQTTFRMFQIVGEIVIVINIMKRRIPRTCWNVYPGPRQCIWESEEDSDAWTACDPMQCWEMTTTLVFTITTKKKFLHFCSSTMHSTLFSDAKPVDNCEMFLCIGFQLFFSFDQRSDKALSKDWLSDFATNAMHSNDNDNEANKARKKTSFVDCSVIKVFHEYLEIDDLRFR